MISLTESEKQFIEEKVKKEIHANNNNEWRLGVVGKKAIRKAIDETILKITEKEWLKFYAQNMAKLSTALKLQKETE